jgi:hypothetical protein
MRCTPPPVFSVRANKGVMLDAREFRFNSGQENTMERTSGREVDSPKV